MDNKYKQKYFQLYKDSDFSIYEISTEVDFVIKEVTGYNSVELLMGKEICQADDDKICEILRERVATLKPLQYLLNRAYFCGNQYFVNDSVLIPRPETEFLVEKIYQFYDKNSKIKILDIGTGSGCIAIELARFYSSAEITAVDICQETLDVAKKNAKKFNFDTKIDFKKSDLFENINDRFDIIVSNPPYIAENDEVQYDVDKYEPHRALYASESGLYFYKHIIQQASEYMLPNSHIAFEVGLKQAISVTSLLEENNFVNIELTKDCDSVDRVVSAVFLA